jgi:hypothetical protein
MAVAALMAGCRETAELLNRFWLPPFGQSVDQE